jgi:hypothetical protein
LSQPIDATLKNTAGTCDLVKLRGLGMKNYRRNEFFAMTNDYHARKARGGAGPAVVGRSLDRHDAVLDGKMNEFGTAVKPVRFHDLVFMKFDGAR